jgi:cytochrome c
MNNSIRIAAMASGLTALLTFCLASVAAEDGQATFNTLCRTCHSTKEGDNRLGPSLYQIYGAKAGTRQGYGNYSQGLTSSGITWDEATLDRFIANPDEVVANNNMKPYKGTSDAAVRKKIIEFLKSSKTGPD